MEIIGDSVNQELIRKTGVALLYSLELGMVLAVLTGLVLICTKKSTAALRYNLLSGLLCLFTTSMGLVLYQQLHSISTFSGKDQIFASFNQINNGTSSHPAIGFSERSIENIWLFLTQNAQFITIFWLLVVLAKGVKMATELYELNYLRRNKVFSIGREWEDRVGVLASKIGIGQQVKIMQSGLVKMPMTMGHFKPVILIPLGVITSIPSEQIEMILLHELAHIRRMDFLVNLLQHFVGLLFFFNPAVLWLSKLIREERENCCDDIALQHSGNKKTYINALLSFREYQLNEPVYALLLSRESGLVQRARRIASQKNTSLNLSGRTFLGITFLIFITFSLVAAQISTLKDEKAAFITAHGLKEWDSRNPENQTNPLRSSSSSDLGSISLEQQAQMTRPNLSFDTANMKAELADTWTPSNSQKPQQDTVPRSVPLMEPIFLAPVRPQYLTSEKSTDSVSYYNGYAGPIMQVAQYNMPVYRVYKPTYSLNESVKLNSGINEQILDEITKAGVKYDRRHVTLHITNDELIVDGVKQSDEIHRQVISKFVQKPGDKIDFRFGTELK